MEFAVSGELPYLQMLFIIVNTILKYKVDQKINKIIEP